MCGSPGHVCGPTDAREGIEVREEERNLGATHITLEPVYKDGTLLYGAAQRVNEEDMDFLNEVGAKLGPVELLENRREREAAMREAYLERVGDEEEDAGTGVGATHKPTDTPPKERTTDDASLPSAAPGNMGMGPLDPEAIGTPQTDGEDDLSKAVENAEETEEKLGVGDTETKEVRGPKEKAKTTNSRTRAKGSK